MKLTDFPTEMQLDYLGVCISTLPCVMKRIISDEEYEAHEKERKEKITGTHQNTEIDDACNDRKIIDYSLQFLEELKGLLEKELEHQDVP